MKHHVTIVLFKKHPVHGRRADQSVQSVGGGEVDEILEEVEVDGGGDAGEPHCCEIEAAMASGLTGTRVLRA